MLTQRTVVGQRPVTVLVSVLDGVALRLGFDAETRLNMLKPHALATSAGAHLG